MSFVNIVIILRLGYFIKRYMFYILHPLRFYPLTRLQYLVWNTTILIIQSNVSYYNYHLFVTTMSDHDNRLKSTKYKIYLTFEKLTTLLHRLGVNYLDKMKTKDLERYLQLRVF